MELKTAKRDISPGATRELRERGMITAELYGHQLENVHLAVSERDFIRIFKEAGENTVINLLIDERPQPALIYDYKKDPLTDKFLSVDFYAVRMDEKITASVPIEFVSEAPAVKEKGGVLVKAMDEAEVEALPANLPQKLSVDLSVLIDVGQSLFVKDIETKGDFKIVVDQETVVATVSEAGAPEEEEGPTSVEEVAVESEEKKAERQTKKEEPQSA